MKKLLVQILAISIAIPSWTAGCYKRVEIPREQLTNNATFKQEDGPYYVERTNRNGQSPVSFSTMRVQNSTLVGELTDRHNSGPMSYQLSDVKRVDRKEFSPGGTVLGLLGVGAGLIAILGIVFVVGMSNSNCCGT
jgi:hypothetical protein